jgi:RNA polymerase sigma-70 factor (ECF subfamily)
LKDKQTINHLLDPCIQGNRRAQELLYSSMAPKLYGLCLRYAKDDDEAQDVLQLGFIKVFKSISSFRREGSFEGWICRIMVNTAIENYHKRKADQKLIDINEVHDLAGGAIEMDALEVQDLLKLIRELPEGFRMVFNMYAIEGYSHKEIAKLLNISEGTSKSQLSRARALLKGKIKIMEGGLYGIKGE